MACIWWQKRRDSSGCAPGTLAGLLSPFLLSAGLLIAGLQLSGCGSGGGTYTNPTEAVSISSQPTSQSVPMGLSATFEVGASGNPLNYQWMKNGSPISGAASSAAYTIPAVAFADSGSVFTVTVSNNLGSVTSTDATLTVTARAPQQGDLRFQQVDSPSTVNGISVGEYTSIGGAPPGDGGVFEQYFGDSIGTPLSIGPGCAPGGEQGSSCESYFEQFPLPEGLTGLTMYYEFFALDSGRLSTELTTLSSSNAVVTGLDVEPLSDVFAASWVQPSTPTSASDTDPWNLANDAFDVVESTIASSDFQAAASQDGANGRVITAVSWNSRQVFYLSYIGAVTSKASYNRGMKSKKTIDAWHADLRLWKA